VFADPDGAQVLVAVLERDLDGVAQALSELAVHLGGRCYDFGEYFFCKNTIGNYTFLVT
jgi:hypothetical protein